MMNKLELKKYSDTELKKKFEKLKRECDLNNGLDEDDQIEIEKIEKELKSRNSKLSKKDREELDKLELKLMELKSNSDKTDSDYSEIGYIEARIANIYGDDDY